MTKYMFSYYLLRDKLEGREEQHLIELRDDIKKKIDQIVKSLHSE